MFDRKYFKINKVYKINGYDYFVMDGGLSNGEAFEPIIDEINGKEVLYYRPIDKYQFTDGTYDNITSITLQEYLINMGADKNDYNNLFTRTLKVMRKVMAMNKQNKVEKTFDLRLSKKALEEIKNMKYILPKKKVKK